MNLKYMIANAVVRRVVYLVIGAAIALGAGFFADEAKAQAASTVCATNSVPLCDEGKAYSQAISEAAAFSCSAGEVFQSSRAVKEPGNTRYLGKQTCKRTSDNNLAERDRVTTFYGAACSARPAYYVGINGGTTAGAPQCDAGCEMKTTGGHQKRTDMRSTSIFTGTGVATATGAVCTNGAATPERVPPKDEFCATMEGGSHQICHTKDGRTCVKSNRTARKYCGNNDYPTVGTDPGRTESVAISASTNPATPAPTPAPRTGETWTPDSSASVTNTTTNTTTNVTNYNNSGTPGTGAPPVPGDGTGNEGEPGEGEGEEGDDWGSPGSGVGELYPGSDKTMETVVAAWWVQMQNTPALGQINTFFGNCGYSGACPSMTYSSEWMGDLNFSQLCDGTMGDILNFAGFVVLAMGAFAAFRIAVY